MPLICEITLSFLAGIVASYYLDMGLIFPAAVAVAALIAALLFSRKSAAVFTAAVCVAALFTAAFMIRVDGAVYESSSLGRYIRARENDRNVEKIYGVVRSPVLMKYDMWRFDLDVESIRAEGGAEAPAQGKISVSIAPEPGDESGDKPPQVRYGDRIAVEGILSGLERIKPDRYIYYISRDVVGFMYPHFAVPIEHLGRVRVNPMFNWGESLRWRFSNTLRASMKGSYASVTEQMLFGTGRQPPKDLQIAFRNTGVIHILVISGQQVTMLFGTFLFIAFLWKRSRWLTLPVMGSCLLVYYAMTGGGASVTRAVIMGFVMLFSMATGRQYDTASALSWTALLLMAVNPCVVFDAGAQLSFLACLGIIIIYPRIAFLAPRQRVASYFAKAFLISISAQIPLYPALAHYFNRISLVSPISNMFAVPVSAALLPLGMALCILGSIWRGFAAILGPVTQAFAWLLVKIVYFFSHIPFCSKVAADPTPLDMALYFAAAAAAVMAVSAWKGKQKERLTWCILASGMSASMLMWLFIFQLPHKDMRVTFIDVGEGDSTLVEAPCGRGGSPLRILIDGGGAYRYATDGYDPGELIVGPLLAGRGITRLDAVILTHPDNDHINGLLWIIENVAVGSIVDLGLNTGADNYRRFKNDIAARNIPYFRGGEGLEISAGNCVNLEFLHPPPDLVPFGIKKANDVSQVFMLRYGDKSALFTADVERIGEEILVEKYRDRIAADVLKVPHHGAAASANDFFLNAVRPKIALISAGRENRYGHPGQITLDRLAALNTRIFRTDKNGTIDLYFPGRGGDITVIPQYK